MSDNTKVSDDPTIAADEIAGVKHQRVKVEWGIDGSAVDTSATNPMPVVVTGAIPAGTAEVGKFEVSDGTNQASVTSTGGDNEGVVAALVDANGDILPLKPPRYATITPTLSTTPAFSAGDSMATAAGQLTLASDASGGTGHLLSVTFIDSDDLTHDGTNGAYYLHIFSGTVTPGSTNAAFALASDTEAKKYIGTIDTDDGIWRDMGTAQVCTVFPPTGPIPYRCVGSTTLYFALVAKTLASGVATASGLDYIPHVVLD